MASRHQYDHQHSQGRGDGTVALESSLYTRADGTGTPVAAPPEGETSHRIQQARGNVFKPYVKPPRRHRDNPDKVLCAEDGCNAFPMKTLEFCTGHARSKGLIEGWGFRGREAE